MLMWRRFLAIKQCGADVAAHIEREGERGAGSRAKQSSASTRAVPTAVLHLLLRWKTHSHPRVRAQPCSWWNLELPVLVLEETKSLAPNNIGSHESDRGGASLSPAPARVPSPAPIPQHQPRRGRRRGRGCACSAERPRCCGGGWGWARSAADPRSP